MNTPQVEFEWTREHGHRMCLSMGHMLDNMSQDDRKLLMIMLTENEILLETVCRAVATSEQDEKLEKSHLHDTWFGCDLKKRLRLALAPLLGEAIADELRRAVEKAEKHGNAARSLESLCHIESMQRDCMGANERHMRRQQWCEEYERAKLMFPQYLPQLATKE